MRKRLIVLLLVIGLNIPAFSQIPGHLGRRFFVATDLTAPILDRGAHLSVEYLLFKGAGLKKYIHKSIIKPPLGGYVEFDWAIGFATFTKGNVEYKNLMTNNWQLGGGYQYIIKRRLLLDIGVFLSNSTITNDPINTLGKYSANLWNSMDGPGFTLRTGIGFLLF